MAVSFPFGVKGILLSGINTKINLLISYRIVKELKDNKLFKTYHASYANLDMMLMLELGGLAKERLMVPLTMPLQHRSI